MFVRHLALAALVAAGPLAAQQPAAQPRFETTQIADGVHQFRWMGHNAFFVVTDAGVVAVDPISLEAAATYATEIKRVAPGKPLRAIVYSHHHSERVRRQRADHRPRQRTRAHPRPAGFRPAAAGQHLHRSARAR
jgi:glyoxylase-like metal-dependent hydrolase (beta-lactamase superfamily II)